MEDSVQLIQGGVYANTTESVSSRGRGLSSMMSYCLENENGLFWDTAYDLW